MSTSDHYDALDDFAGPGGWDQGARLIGLRLFGVDHDHAACQTAQAAGHERETADVTTHPSPAWARGRGLVSSPSCTLFSMAGSGVGRLVLDPLADGIRDILRGQDPATVRTRTRDAIFPVALAEAQRGNAKRKAPLELEKVAEKAQEDAKIAALVLEPARRIVELDPEWVALEQVPEVLPLWQVYKHELRAQGWSCFALVLNAADYGVPQTRRRAIFGAHRTRAIAPPPPTHAEHPQDDDLFGDSLRKWVCMADALGWGWEDEPSCTVSSGGTAAGGAEPFANAEYRRRLRDYVVDRRTNSKAAGGSMAPTVTVPVTRPAPTLTGKAGTQWVIRPSQQWITGRPVTVSVAEAGVLQSFPPDYRWQGSKSKQYEQVGNAIPPLFAAHVLAAIAGRTVPSAETANAVCTARTELAA
ncbi:DNA cytosine methyltransferase [Nocardioides sp. NPDC006273]|uniref:DNA cytosine methyltransferase n=1 Tax=Nocardioides sp. NPDC006273 TaxID=3155598 RepID=UPI0033AE3221